LRSKPKLGTLGAKLAAYRTAEFFVLVRDLAQGAPSSCLRAVVGIVVGHEDA
jgi:hypothetical protein